MTGETLYCANCGSQRPRQGSFCTVCGSSLDRAASEQPTAQMPPPSAAAPQFAEPSVSTQRPALRVGAPGVPVGSGAESGQPYQVVYQVPSDGEGRGLMIGAGVACVLAAIGVAVAVIVATSDGGGDPQQVTQATTSSAVAAGRLRLAAVTADAGNERSPRASAPSPSPSDGGATTQPSASTSSSGDMDRVAGVLRRHFALIAAHDYDSAYDLLAPGLFARGKWVADHRRDNVSEASISVVPRLAGVDSAVARVISMRTVADDGCRTWSGYYEMQKIDGAWRIGPAHLASATC